MKQSSTRSHVEIRYSSRFNIKIKSMIVLYTPTHIIRSSNEIWSLIPHPTWATPGSGCFGTASSAEIPRPAWHCRQSAAGRGSRAAAPADRGAAAHSRPHADPAVQRATATDDAAAAAVSSPTLKFDIYITECAIRSVPRFCLKFSWQFRRRLADKYYICCAANQGKLKNRNF